MDSKMQSEVISNQMLGFVQYSIRSLAHAISIATTDQVFDILIQQFQQMIALLRKIRFCMISQGFHTAYSTEQAIINDLKKAQQALSSRPEVKYE